MGAGARPLRSILHLCRPARGRVHVPAIRRDVSRLHAADEDVRALRGVIKAGHAGAWAQLICLRVKQILASQPKYLSSVLQKFLLIISVSRFRKEGRYGQSSRNVGRGMRWTQGG